MAKDPAARIQQLEKHLTRESDSFNPNPLLELVGFARHEDPRIVHSAIWALHRVFIKIIGDGRVGRASFPTQVQEETSNGDTTEGGEGWQVREWIMQRLVDYIDVLAGLMRDAEEALRSSAVPLLFSLVPSLSLAASPPPGPAVIHIPYMRILIRHTLYPTPSLRGSKEVKGALRPRTASQIGEEEGVLPADVAQMIQEDFWAKYDDLRWAFFREAPNVIQQEGRSIPNAGNVMNQLVPLTNLPKVQDDLNAFFVPALASPPPGSSTGAASSSKKQKGAKSKKGKGKETELDATPDWMAYFESDNEDEDDDAPAKAGTKRRVQTSHLSIHASVHSIPSHQTVYSVMWETTLGQVRLDDYWIRKVLVGLHGEKGILGNMKVERRVRLTDWLGTLIDGGGANAMLAMNGLYVLMTQYNLDYPNFYQRLYGLLDRDVMHVKYRARFFRLLDTFLSSPLLPAAMIASFVKRLSRLALVSPPAGIIMLIPFIYNLFKRHPGCMVMIQRLDDEGDDAIYKDPYNADDKSPFSSGAIKSSCWELATLQSHYLSSVSIMAKIFTEVFTKPEFNMEDFMDHGYGTLFETETKRKIKYPPPLSVALEMGEVGELFPSKEVEPEARPAGDIVAQLWSF